METLDEWLAFRLDALSVEHRFASLSLSEAVRAWWMSYNLVAQVGGGKTATFGLRSDASWGLVRVGVVVERAKPSGGWAPTQRWEHMNPAERYRMLDEARGSVVAGDFTDVCLRAAEWAHTQQRPENVRAHLRAGSEVAMHGDSRAFLPELVSAHDGPEVDAARTLGALRGYTMP